MKKRKYVKPSFEVVVLNRQAQLLAGSAKTVPGAGTGGFSSFYIDDISD